MSQDPDRHPEPEEVADSGVAEPVVAAQRADQPSSPDQPESPTDTAESDDEKDGNDFEESSNVAALGKAVTSGRRFGSEVHDATRMYLSEIGFSPLLSAEEEVYY